jgi:hypothetical protein
MGSGEAKREKEEETDLTQRTLRSEHRVRREEWKKLREANREIGIPGLD